jgi:hypothetical protein
MKSVAKLFILFVLGMFAFATLRTDAAPTLPDALLAKNANLFKYYVGKYAIELKSLQKLVDSDTSDALSVSTTTDDEDVNVTIEKTIMFLKGVHQSILELKMIDYGQQQERINSIFARHLLMKGEADRLERQFTRYIPTWSMIASK